MPVTTANIPEKIPLTPIDVSAPETEIQYKELYEGHRVYVRKTEGRFQRLRRYIVAPLLLAFFFVPMVKN